MNRFNSSFIVERAAGSKVNVFLLASIIVVSTVSLWVIQQNRKLSSRMSEMGRQCLQESNVVVGGLVPPFNGMDLEAVKRPVWTPGPRAFSLVQIVSTTCASSGVQMRQWWPQLATDIRLEKSSPKLVSLDSLNLTLEKMDSDLSVGTILVAPEKVFKRAFRINKVPVLVLISGSGEVQWLHEWVLTERRFEQLLTVLEQKSSLQYGGL